MQPYVHMITSSGLSTEHFACSTLFIPYFGMICPLPVTKLSIGCQHLSSGPVQAHKDSEMLDILSIFDIGHSSCQLFWGRREWTWNSLNVNDARENRERWPNQHLFHFAGLVWSKYLFLCPSCVTKHLKALSPYEGWLLLLTFPVVFNCFNMFQQFVQSGVLCQIQSQICTHITLFPRSPGYHLCDICIHKVCQIAMGSTLR